MIALLGASAIFLTALQAVDQRAHETRFEACLKEASSKAASDKVARRRL